jgi:glycosyltransferase involved in cell wall biosynthesis
MQELGRPVRMLFFADASSVHTRRWVAAVAERGAQVVLISRQKGEVPGAQQVITIAPGEDKASWFKALPEVRRVVRELARTFQPDLVHGHYVTSYGLWAAACGLKVPKVMTAWGSDILVTPKESRLMRWVVGWTLRRADLITADSLDMVEEISSYHPSASVQQILWGADTDKFVPGHPATDFEVISLRSWEPNYNIDLIIEAFARFVSMRPHSHALLHLLGGGSMESILQERVASLRLLQQVRFHGRVGDQAMVDAIGRCRASVSVPTSDATSVSVLESMACGLPVIASDLPANRQWIDQRGGIIVPVRDIDALTNALVTIHDQPAQAQAQGSFNRARVVKEGSRRGQMDRMWQLYEQMLRPNVKAGKGQAQRGQP